MVGELFARKYNIRLVQQLNLSHELYLNYDQ